MDTRKNLMEKAYTLDVIERSIATESGNAYGLFRGLRLSSDFQPVFSLAHGRAVGYEALLRATDPSGIPVAPNDAFRIAHHVDEVALLDRLARAIHVRNFIAQPSAGPSWLFLNVSPYVISTGRRNHGRFFDELLSRYDIPPQRIVVEILESALQSDVPLAPAMDSLRERGFLIAIDDFGAGHSNFDRIWQLKPNIVKLDRSLLKRASGDRLARLILPRITSMLHEAGSLVLMEGVEDESQAMMAMDADADFVQGYFFARPAPVLAPVPAGEVGFDALFNQFQRLATLEHRDYQSELAPYAHALKVASQQLADGVPESAAIAGFLDLPLAERCYLLDGTGHQFGPSLLSNTSRAQADARYAPIADSLGSNFARRHYFRRAILRPGHVHITRPYLSLPTATMCVTVSIAIGSGKASRVLCGDIQWNEVMSTGDRTIDTAVPMASG